MKHHSFACLSHEKVEYCLILTKPFFFVQGNKETRNATSSKEKASDWSMDQDREDPNENKLVEVIYNCHKP